jgi:hypothetical protein
MKQKEDEEEEMKEEDEEKVVKISISQLYINNNTLINFFR